MKSRKKTLLLFVSTIFTAIGFAQSGTGAIKGRILNTDNEPVFGATIKITAGGVLVGGTTTDFDGKYVYNEL